MLEVLKQVGCPKPCKKVADEPETEKVPEPKEECKEGKKAPGKPKKKRSSGKVSKPHAKVDKDQNKDRFVYKPGQFNETFRTFVKDMKASGLNHAASLKAWSVSDVRKRLLADLPLSEKRRGGFSKGLKVALQTGGVSRMFREPGFGGKNACFQHGSLGQDKRQFRLHGFLPKKSAQVRFWTKAASFRLLFWLLWVFPAMVSVADMLRWKLPPILIMCVLLLRFGAPNCTPNTLDFVEVFCGQAEISKALRQVSRSFLSHIFLF